LSKTSKTIALLALLVLGGILLKNIFSGKDKDKESFNPKVYEYKLKPISFPNKNFHEYYQDNDDLAIKLVHLWKLSDMYKKGSEACLKTWSDQHPNNLVQRQSLTSLYGIDIGTSNWYELTSAYEKYATESCYAYSGREIENIYADILKEKLTQDELSQLLKFFDTELGKKYVTTSGFISEKIQTIIAQKQRIVSNRESEIYNKKIEALQKRIQ
jgi:hypothetical protein